MPSEPYKSLWKSNCVISSSNKWNVLKMETNYQVISFWKIMCYWIFFLCICWERGWNWFYPNGSWLQRLNCLKECIYRFGVYITVSFLYIYIIYCYWYSFIISEVLQDIKELEKIATTRWIQSFLSLWRIESIYVYLNSYKCTQI